MYIENGINIILWIIEENQAFYLFYPLENNNLTVFLLP